MTPKERPSVARPVVIGGDPKREYTSFVQVHLHADDHLTSDWVIYDMYQVYAVCGRCGAHDWGEEFYDKDGREVSAADLLEKYPGARVVGLDATL